MKQKKEYTQLYFKNWWLIAKIRKKNLLEMATNQQEHILL